MNRLDFVIAGCAKSGTTMLAEMLDRHPGVHLSDVKETNYFVDGYGGIEPGNLHNGHRFQASLDAEQRIDRHGKFRALLGDPASRQLRGEASPLYMLVPEVPGRLLEYSPELKILLLLRNPTDVAFANFVHHVRDRAESIAVDDVDRFLDWRRYACSDLHPFSRHLGIARYAEHLPRWIAAFAPERLCCLVFEEFVADPVEGLATVLEFLELPMLPGLVQLEPVNSSRLPRREWLHTAVLGLPRLKRLVRPLVPTKQRRRLRLHVERLNAGVRPELPLQARRELDARYATDREFVERLLGRPIETWRSRLAKCSMDQQRVQGAVG